MQNWLTKQAETLPNQVAVTDGQQSMTFEALFNDAQIIAGQLLALGIAEGKSVAVLANNSLSAYRVAMALLGSGRPIVWLNKRLPTSELRRQVADSKSTVLLVEDELWREGFATAFRFSELLSIKANTVTLKPEFGDDSLVSVMYTSGTTGQPKGVMQSFGNHFSSAVSSALNLGLTPNDRWLCAVPIFHISGFSILMRGLIYGMTVRLMAQFDAQLVHNSLVQEPITAISVVPYMLKKLLAMQEKSPEAYNVHFRTMLLGGGPIDRPTLKRCQKFGIKVVQSYGMTETASQIVALNAEDAPNKIGSVGKPLFLTQLKINEAGEILVKSPVLTQGYLGKPEVFAAKMAHGWYHTGDVGHFDEDGFLFVDGRFDDMIISGGENLFPNAIEAVYQAFDGVSEIAVVGAPDEEWGMVPVAFVVGESSLSSANLLAFGRQFLAHYQVPKRFIFVNELPKNVSGKVQRMKLRERLAQGI